MSNSNFKNAILLSYESFIDNKIHLRSLLDSWERLLHESDIATEAKDELFDQWDVAEIIYATAAFEERGRLSEEEVDKVMSAINTFVQIVNKGCA